MKPVLTILITVYNKEKYISYILHQLIFQNSDRIQVHIVDDGSTDDSISIIEEVLAETEVKNFYLHRRALNKGTGYTRNECLSYVDTDWFTFVDADDMLGEQYVQKLLEYIDNDNGETDIHNFLARIYPIGLIGVYGFSLWDRIIRTKFIKDNNITFNSELTNMEDWNFTMRMEKYNPRIKEYKDVLYIYNLMAEGTITHEEPIWYNHNLDGIREEATIGYDERYNL